MTVTNKRGRPKGADISQQLKTLRRIKGLTQWQLALLTGIPVTNISRWERGYCNPSRRDTLKQIKALLGDSK